jgi:hypothetical protein
MSPLFRKSQEKEAEEAAAQAEFERLNGLPVPDLAAELLPAFSPDQKRSAHGPLIAANWLMASYPGGTKYLKPLQEPVREAMQALEHAGLLIMVTQNAGGAKMDITRLGETALAQGTVREYLQPAG